MWISHAAKWENATNSSFFGEGMFAFLFWDLKGTNSDESNFSPFSYLWVPFCYAPVEKKLQIRRYGVALPVHFLYSCPFMKYQRISPTWMRMLPTTQPHNARRANRNNEGRGALRMKFALGQDKTLWQFPEWWLKMQNSEASYDLGGVMRTLPDYLSSILYCLELPDYVQDVQWTVTFR